MCLKNVKVWFLKTKIKVFMLDIVDAERARAQYVPGNEPKELAAWIEARMRGLEKAKETLNKIYAENRKHWDRKIKKLESELSEINGYLSTLRLSEKVALKLINKKIPSTKKKIAKAKNKRDRYS